MFVPTCDDAKSPTLKAFVHGVTVVLHLMIAAYHWRNVLFHLGHRKS